MNEKEKKANKKETINPDEIVTKTTETPETIEDVVGQDREDETENQDQENEMPLINNNNKKGIVFNCLVLNVRDTPAFDGIVKTTIPKWSEVVMDELESTDEFYGITTHDGIVGFCARAFIKL